ncbi:MAG: dipeptide epimerase [Leptolyngbyaceae cyanobacterium MO_188.B28]|nr:dipeptide epimerase [Leptolyngbyaceae cyanobacterium MO_188.B28]
MQVHIHPFTVHKRTPLTISRGTSAQSANIWLRIEQDSLEGWGEASPFSIGPHRQTRERIAAELEQLIPVLESLHPLEQQRIEALVKEANLSSATRAALDVALQDWLGKRVGLPLWRLWGLNLRRISPTSVTIGISSPAAARQRLQDWLTYVSVRSIKVKLGSPEGIQADQAMLAAIVQDSPSDVKISVDANGGWSLKEAVQMADWLTDQGIDYIEQPLAVGQEQDLPKLYARSPIPIFVDESCFNSQDIPSLADRVHGINIKLMKSGGLTEARRMIHTARALGLQVMFGCYSDSAIANTALAHLSPLADHLDLDSHLNLKDDPFRGANLENGCLIPNRQPGLGITYHASHG